MAILILMLTLLTFACGTSGDQQGNTCNFPTLVESTPDGGDQLFLCGDGSILECRGGSCSFGAGNAGDVPTTVTTDSENPVDSNNRTTNVSPTPTPRFGN